MKVGGHVTAAPSFTIQKRPGEDNFAIGGDNNHISFSHNLLPTANLNHPSAICVPVTSSKVLRRQQS